MSGSVTGFGTIFALVAAYCVLFNRKWLLPLTGLAVVLQAPSVIAVDASWGRVGVGAFTLCALLMVIHGGLAFAPRRRTLIAEFVNARELRPWSVFFLVALVSSVLGPLVFTGLLVYPPLDKLGVEGEARELAWSVSQFAQAVNVILISGLFIWICGCRRHAEVPIWLARALFLSLALAAAIGLQQRLAWNGLVPMWAEFWASNATYAQDYRTYAGSVPRVSWPFVDPSYASAFFAAMFGGLLAMFLAGQRTNGALLGLMVALFALGNTLGATGGLAIIVMAVVTVVVLLGICIGRAGARGALVYRLLLLALAASCVLLGSYLVLRHHGLLAVSSDTLSNALAGRGEGLLGDIRPQADLMSLRLLAETWGLGVGMGSHRGSSYLFTLAANTGVLGLVTFLAANVMHFTLLTKRFIRHPDAPSAFFLGSGISVLIAVSIAIPDQNWPVYWILILGGFACIICPAEGEKAEGFSGEDSAETPDQPASRAG